MFYTFWTLYNISFSDNLCNFSFLIISYTTSY